MGAHRSLRHAAAVAATAALLAAVSCLDPTEVTLVITTDVPCSLNRGTSITVGGAGDDLVSKPPLTITQDCTLASPNVDDSGALTTPANIGTLVVVPSGGRSDSFAVQIVTAIDTNMSPMDCLQMKMQGMKLTNCIFASREIAFIPHTPITLPIEITLDCKDIDCTQGETCDHGVCRSNMASGMGCTGGGPCTEGLVDASPDVSGPPADASSDLSVQDSLVTDQFVDQAMADTVTDVPGSDEAPGSDATVEDASDATTTDAPGDVLEASIDASPDTSHVDAAVEAAADATTDAGFDATADAGADSPVDAPGEGPPPSDAGGSPDVLGGCVGAGSPKVPCGASTCSSGQICCVTNQLASAPTEACTSPSSCPIQATGYPFYWALSCRNSSDCPSSAPICCYQPADAGSGTVSNCATSCPTGFGQTKIGCQNGCECTAVGGTCAQVTCYGGFYGICGNGGGACP